MPGFDRYLTKPSAAAAHKQAGELKRRARGEVVVDDFFAGGKPYPGLGRDVFQSGFERVDAVRHAHQVRMNGDGHDATRALALTGEDIELPPAHAVELLGRDVVVFDGDLVVQLRRIRNRAQPLAAHVHEIRLL